MQQWPSLLGAGQAVRTLAHPPVRRLAVGLTVLALLSAACSGAPDVGEQDVADETDDTEVLGQTLERTPPPADPTPTPTPTEQAPRESPTPDPTPTPEAPGTADEPAAAAQPDPAPRPVPSPQPQPEPEPEPQPEPEPAADPTPEPMQLPTGSGWSENALQPDDDGEGWTETSSQPPVTRDGSGERLFVRLVHREVEGDRAGRWTACTARIEAPQDRGLEATGTVTMRLLHGDEVVREVPRGVDLQLGPGETSPPLGWNDEQRVHALEGRSVRCTVRFDPA